MRFAATFVVALSCFVPACHPASTASSAASAETTAHEPAAVAPPAGSAARVDAATLHASSIVVDTHDDVTQRLVSGDADLGAPLPEAQTDIPRMREGGLDAEFLSVWVPPMLYPGEKAYQRSLQELDAIDRTIAKNAAVAVLARSAEEVRAASTAGKIAFLIGVEGGHGLGDASDDELLGRLRTLYDRGVRYMTLTWSNSNRLGGSSGDAGKEKGLTPFGERVVHEMNDLGMVVDISHVSDKTFTDAVRLSRSPVLASHSSARALSPHPRNMTDDMLRAVRDDGGAVCVNFGPEFLDEDYDAHWKAAQNSAGIGALVKAHAGDPDGAGKAIWEKLVLAANTLPKVPASKVIDHIEHVARVAGVEHTCLGSDFDGIPTGPVGLEDVSKFPFVTRELLARGFTPDDVRKILGENVLRVLAANERGRTPSQ
ncbi:MAG TPA: dipeptidase [Polyangiaceae bacterium]|nr:dipeptidase [Polyangiaceae bacterium]